MPLPLFDAANGQKVTSATTNTFSHTVTNAQSNEVIVVWVDSGVLPSGVTYAGTSLTELDSISYQGGTEFLSLWEMLAPSNGAAQNVVITCPSSTFIIGLSESYYNAAQSGTFGTAAHASGGTTPTSNTVATSNTNQLVLDALNNVAGNIDTANAGQTKRLQVASSGVAAGDIAATGANMTLGWGVGGNVGWAEISVAMLAAFTSLAASPASLTFSASGSQVVQLTNNGTEGAENWTATIVGASPWLSASPASGSLGQGLSTNVTVTVSTTGLNPGQTYNDTVRFATSGAPNVDVPVQLTVPSLSIYAPFVTPGAVIGPNITMDPYWKYASKMGPVIRRANGRFFGGRGLSGKNPMRKKWFGLF